MGGGAMRKMPKVDWENQLIFNFPQYKPLYMFTGFGSPFLFYPLGVVRDQHGDDLEVFIPPSREAKKWAGQRSLWVEEYGFGKTPAEAKATYQKYYWVWKTKSQIKFERKKIEREINR
jgi:hypothetical protein